ncbi:MAG: ferric reductase-like transmembrane domain-containing protein [Phycisphaeraceae bacterium]|nr:ferric reductase-like transmembrane domain-containing protein [Phycisphaeraceae bacterium]
MPEGLPSNRMVRGYAVVFGTAVLSVGLWLLEMARAGEMHTNPWIYPAKVGSHGTLILMCWAFILATRFRPIEWLFGGLDKVYKAHRVIGEVAFFLIFLHPIFLAVAHSDSPGAFARYLWFSDDWARNTGLVALAAFTVLVVLSIYWKIPYHRWKRTHDLFGLVLVLVAVHAVLGRGEMVKYPLLTIWYASWTAIGLAAYVYIRVLYRFIGPQYDVVTTEVRQRPADITDVYLKFVGRRMRFTAGQFLYVSFDSDAVTSEPHPFTISSPPEEPNPRLTIKRLGDWTGDVHRIRPGERARVWGPYGHFGSVLQERPDLPVVMIGGGVGITPFLSIIGSEVFAQRKEASVVIYSVPNEARQVHVQEITSRADQLPDLRAVMHLSDESGYIDRDYLRATLERPLPDYVWMLCGPDAMTDSIREQLLAEGVRPKQVVIESFDIR